MVDALGNVEPLQTLGHLLLDYNLYREERREIQRN